MIPYLNLLQSNASSMTTLDEKMKRISEAKSGQSKQASVVEEGPKGIDHKVLKWDVLESGVENVYLLRNQSFEKYLISEAESRPKHWPKAWLTPDVIWDSVGMLWAENELNTGSDGDEDGSSYAADKAADRPLLAEFKDTNGDPENLLEMKNLPKMEDPNAKTRALIDGFTTRMRNEAQWDYLVVYFDQCLVEVNPYAELAPSVADCTAPASSKSVPPEDIVMGGFFDGVCTVSIRTPVPNNAGEPYLRIGAMAMEKSLSEYENEKVAKSMIDAVVKLGQAISKDVEQLQKESVWHSAFVSHGANQQVLKPEKLLVCMPLDLPDDDREPGDDHLKFWKDRLGFQDPSSEEASIILQEYRTLLQDDIEIRVDDNNNSIDSEKTPSSPTFLFQRSRSAADDAMIVASESTCNDTAGEPIIDNRIQNLKRLKFLVI
jgi:hypothetical protein